MNHVHHPQQELSMTSDRDEDFPSWLRTAAPFGAGAGILPEYPWPNGPPLGAGMPSRVGVLPPFPPVPVGPSDLLPQRPLNPFLPYVQNWPPLLAPPGASASAANKPLRLRTPLRINHPSPV